MSRYVLWDSNTSTIISESTDLQLIADDMQALVTEVSEEHDEWILDSLEFKVIPEGSGDAITYYGQDVQLAIQEHLARQRAHQSH